MAQTTQTIRLAPVTRVEGHLDVEVTLGEKGGRLEVVDARSAGTAFRGFEILMRGRAPLDAVQLSQRVCGVCPVSHGVVSSLALESASGVAVPDNGRIVRNLVLGANFLQSHILHFYHLMVLDYVKTAGLLPVPPWSVQYTSPDLATGDVAARFVAHYTEALAARRKAHQMGAVFAGRLPCSPMFAPGGVTTAVTAEKIADFRAVLAEVHGFIAGALVPDAQLLGERYPDYYKLGRGCGNLLAFGVFDLDGAGTKKLLARGRLSGDRLEAVEPARIREYVSSAWYTEASGNCNPAAGVTEPREGKPGAYSWIKAPRYDGAVYEVGPLARMWMTGDYRKGISVMDRVLARALEAAKIADAMAGWLGQFVPGEPAYEHRSMPITGTGLGLAEASRGALGHWVDIVGGRLSRYQIVTPTAWNASPCDDAGLKGAMEQALIGTPVGDPANPVEVLRVVHSFDPCLACAVHTVRI
jgi:hydrogenase large subunit